MQGGLHPEFKLEWYEELLRDIKSHFPQLNIHGFQPAGDLPLHNGYWTAAANGARTIERGRSG